MTINPKQVSRTSLKKKILQLFAVITLVAAPAIAAPKGAAVVQNSDLPKVLIVGDSIEKSLETTYPYANETKEKASEMQAHLALESLDATKPNVLLIAIDDLNDWIGCMGGHPQAKTPNMDRLAARGVLFNNAHCQSPVCNPSRASMMTSLYPSTTGVYFLSPDLSESLVAKKNTLMPKRFQNEGYHVMGAGKLFHGNQNRKYFPNWAGSFGGFGPFPDKKISAFPGPQRSKLGT